MIIGFLWLSDYEKSDTGVFSQALLSDRYR